MAMIEKLQIRGIRAFSPNCDETIEFYSPLTMIVGANGCGKTTIIECLNLACTGTLPPSSSGGKVFINDPAMTDSTEVKAHIKIRFSNRVGRPTVVARSFQLTKKKAKLEFKTLDGVVRMEDNEGNKSSISYKCIELDKQVPDLLGVSAAILENVIFCHQEDSTWPLQEPAILKKKFDDIFESTRYSKALEAILKTKKDFSAKSKDLKLEVAVLGEHLKTAKDTRRTLEDAELKYDTCQREIDDIANVIERDEQRYNEIRAIHEASGEAFKECSRLQNDIDRLSDRVKDRTISLKQEFIESDEVLTGMLNNFESSMSSKSSELDGYKRQINEFNSNINAKRDRQNAISARIGEAFATKQAHEGRQNEFRNLLTKIMSEMNISIGGMSMASSSGAIDDRYVSTVIEDINTKIASSDSGYKESVIRAREKEQSAENEYMKANTDLVTLKSELRNIDEILQKCQNERVSLRSELDKCELRFSRKGEAENEYKNAKSNYEDFMATYPNRIAKMSEEKKVYEEQLRQLNDQISSDGKILNELSLNRAESERLDAQAKQLTQADSSCFLEIKKLVQEFMNLMDDDIDSGVDIHPNNIRDIKDLERFIDLLKRKLHTKEEMQIILKEKYENIRKNVSDTNASLQQTKNRIKYLTNNTKSLSEKEKELKELIPELQSLRDAYVDADEMGTNTTNFMNDSVIDLDDLINVCRVTETAVQEAYTAWESAKLWRDKLLKKSRKGAGKSTSSSSSSSVKCPCCDRSMNQDENAVFEQKLQELFKYEKLDGATLDLRRCKELRPKINYLVDELRPLRKDASEIESLQSNLMDIEQNYDSLLREEKREEKNLNDCIEWNVAGRSAVYNLNLNYNKWHQITVDKNDIAMKRNQFLERLSVTAKQSFSSSSISDLEDTQRRREQDRNILLQRKERVIDEEYMQTAKMNKLKDELSRSNIALVEVSQKEKDHTIIESKVRECESTLTTNKEMRRIKSLELNEKERNVQDKKSQLDIAKKFVKTCEEESYRVQNLYKQNRDNVSTKYKELKDSKRQLDNINLPAIEEEQRTLANSMKEVETKLIEAQNKAKGIEEQILKQSSLKDIINDNLILRKLKKDELEMRSLLEAKKKELGGTQKVYQEQERDMQRIQTELSRSNQKKAELKGRKDSLKEQVQEIIKKLSNDTLKGIDERFRKKNIEYETTNMAVSDLECYYTALDSALQKFHMLRINEINKILKELWQLVYQGKDIESIELVSGSEETGGAVGRAAKSYNYRVVMCKGDAQLDMRGRCSAGQRILAGIVIRLALAETFCLKCGILALDEPTTNLDDANKAGLARALARIINARNRQHNFQFICITHDDEFVQMMKSELSAISNFSMPEFYFRISRQEEGNTGKYFSHIDRCLWNDLL